MYHRRRETAWRGYLGRLDMRHGSLIERIIWVVIRLNRAVVEYSEGGANSGPWWM